MGREVEYVVFEDEGHGFTKRTNELKAYRLMAEWVERHLVGVPGKYEHDLLLGLGQVARPRPVGQCGTDTWHGTQGGQKTRRVNVQKWEYLDVYYEGRSLWINGERMEDPKKPPSTQALLNLLGDQAGKVAAMTGEHAGAYALLNLLGAQGWELVSAVGYSGDGGLRLLLKRPTA